MSSGRANSATRRPGATGRGLALRARTPIRDGAGAPLPPPKEQAGHHREARRARATQAAEDYVEMVADLIDGSGEARVVDIARRLGVTHVTVIRTIARLKKKGLVTMRPYRAVFLTADGRRMAERVRRRHQIVVQFLEAVGVSPETARADAEGLEHHVSRETLAAMERFIERRG